jgi:hypothetical protein
VHAVSVGPEGEALVGNFPATAATRRSDDGVTGTTSRGRRRRPPPIDARVSAPEPIEEAPVDWTLEVVVLPVTDLDRAIAFYRDQVGFVLDHRRPTSTWTSPS